MMAKSVMHDRDVLLSLACKQGFISEREKELLKQSTAIKTDKAIQIDFYTKVTASEVSDWCSLTIDGVLEIDLLKDTPHKIKVYDKVAGRRVIYN